MDALSELEGAVSGKRPVAAAEVAPSAKRPRGPESASAQQQAAALLAEAEVCAAAAAAPANVVRSSRASNRACLHSASSNSRRLTWT